MKALLQVLAVATAVIWIGSCFEVFAAHAQEATPGAAASQYTTDAVEPVPVNAAASASSSASASASALLDASTSPPAVVQSPEGMPPVSDEPASSASASAPSSASPTPTEPGGETGADPVGPSACDNKSCDGDAPVADDKSLRPRDPRIYPGFLSYERSTDEYIYQIDCKTDCGVEAEHPPNFDCYKNIRRKFNELGEVHRQKTIVTCVHPRFDDWESGKAMVPERWKGQRCVYFYDEEGRLKPGGLRCEFGPGGAGILDSADDAADVDDRVGRADPHSSPDGGREVAVGSAFWRVFGALVFGEANRQERNEAVEDGDAKRQVKASAPVGQVASQERKKESAASPNTGGSKATASGASAPVGSTPMHRSRTALRGEARVPYDREGNAERGDGSRGSVRAASVLAERLLARSSEEGSSGSVVGSARSTDNTSDSIRQGMVEGDGKNGPAREVEGATQWTSKVSGSSSETGEDGPGDQRIQAVGSDSLTWGRSRLLLLAGALFLGTTLVVRRRL